MGPLTIDASVFVRSMSPGENGHGECVQLIERAGAARVPVVLPVLALIELAAGLARRRVPEPLMRELLGRMRQMPLLTLVPLDEALMEETVDVVVSTRTHGADSVYVAVARRYGSTLVTLDEEQRIRAPKGIEALRPDQALGELEARWSTGSGRSRI
jgi:predicted nucleic acid-binding protein